MSKVKPITPREARAKKVEAIPDAVYEAVNELLTENMNDSGYVTITQKEIKALACKRMGINSTQFKTSWLDFEDAYRKAGWKVEYDKPAMDENYDPFFKFSA